MFPRRIMRYAGKAKRPVRREREPRKSSPTTESLEERMNTILMALGEERKRRRKGKQDEP